MPRPKKTEEEIAAMRRRILDAAVTLFQRDGLDGVSIRKIAELIGVSHMSLYNYFENREAILKALRECQFEKLEGLCAESLRRAETGDALEQVRTLLGRFIRLSHEQPRFYQMAWRQSSVAKSLQGDSQNMARILDHLSRLIQLCMERGQCIERDPTLAAVMAFSIVNGSLVLYHNVAAVGQIERGQMETEVIEAAITYLTESGNAAILN